MRQKNTIRSCIFPPWLSRLLAIAHTLKDTSQTALGRGKVALTLLPDGPEITWLWTAQHREAFLTGDIRLRGSLTWPFHF